MHKQHKYAFVYDNSFYHIFDNLCVFSDVSYRMMEFLDPTINNQLTIGSQLFIIKLKYSNFFNLFHLPLKPNHSADIHAVRSIEMMEGTFPAGRPESSRTQGEEGRYAQYIIEFFNLIK